MSSTQIVFLDVVAKRPEAHPQQFRGFNLDAAGTLQGLRQIASLDLLDVRFEIKAFSRQAESGAARGRRHQRRSRRTRSIAPDTWREALRENRRRRREGDGAFDGVFEF